MDEIKTSECENEVKIEKNDFNAVFQNITNVKTITYSIFALRIWPNSISIDLFIPKEIIT